MGGVLAVRTSNVTVNSVITRRFNYPLIFTGGGGAGGVTNSICMAPIRSFARNAACGIVISGHFLNGNSGILVISSFLTINGTLHNLVRVIGRDNTRLINYNAMVRGNCRRKNSRVETRNIHIRDLTVVRDVSTGAKGVIFEG